MKFTRLIIFLGAFLSLSASALWFDNMPKLPMFGDFDPNQLRQYYNEFIGKQPDFNREDRMIKEIEESVMDGDVEYLPLKDGREVFTIFMESEAEKPKGAVILLHSRGYHANWATVVKPLRVGLAEKGWHTLSVQMPVLDKEAKYYDYVPIFPYAHERIDVAVDFLKEKGVNNIHLIGHGCGAHMSMSYIDKYGDSKFNSYVGIGMGATDYKQKLVKPFPIENMVAPILDIFGENDFPGVKRMSEERKKQLSQKKPDKSIQLVVGKADHYYKEESMSTELVDRIDSWLSNLYQ